MFLESRNGEEPALCVEACTAVSLERHMVKKEAEH